MESLSGYTFIVDNCRTHHSKSTRNFLFQYFDILFLPPYSSFMNPIEEVFYIRKKSIIEKFNENKRDLI